MMIMQDDSFASQRGVLMMLRAYEERHHAYTSERLEDRAKMVLGGHPNEMFAELVETSERLRNPFAVIFHWVKGMIHDVKAMDECIVQRANLIAQIPKIRAKRAQLATELQGVQDGKTSFKTFFKSNHQIEALKKDIQ
jgi:hypothetical protein